MTTIAATFDSNRPTALAWSKMPVWFHGATLVYFATNIFNGWAFLYLKAPAGATALTLFGLIGGFIEHISPYFPKLYIHPVAEKILFRVPTVIGGLWLTISLGLAWYVTAIIALQSVVFLSEKPLTSMDWKFHAQHVFGTHLLGALQTFAVILAVTGQSAWLASLLMR